MVSLTLIAVGFLVAMAVVMALARRSTARWEQDKRALAAVRARVSTRTSPAGPAAGEPSAMTREGVAALRRQAARFPPPVVLAGLLPKGMKHETPGGRQDTGMTHEGDESPPAR